MSQQDQTKTTAFVKKFNSIMDTITNLHSLSQLAHLFNDLPEIDDRVNPLSSKGKSQTNIIFCLQGVKQVFYHYLNHYDNLKIKKCLDIFEFLTFHSNAQLIKILNDEKFIELLPYALSDDELLEPALNLLKLWADKYREEKHDMAPIFDCIDGLSAFGIFLPSSYSSKYEGSVLEPAEPVAQEEKPQPPAGNALATHVKSKILSIIERGGVLRDESRSLLDDNTFQYHSDEFKKELLEGLLGSHRQLALEKSGIKLDNAVDEIKENVERLFIVLKAQEKKLAHMLEKVEKNEKKGNKDDDVESVTSVETNGDHYKIVISGAEDKQKSGFSTAMTRDEFMDYKIYPCQKGIDCPYHCVPEHFSEEERNFHEVHCPYWHSEHDKRRPVEDEGGFRKYFSNLCDELPHCTEGDACDFSHNFFEKTFHPTNYKKHKCILKADECLNGKYCPDYHSKNEEENWKFSKFAQNASFASNSGNDSEASYGDYDPNAVAQFWEKEAMKALDEDAGTVKDLDPRQVILRFHGGQVELRENIEAVVERKAREANRLKELEEQQQQQKLELKGHIESKLVVRKSYNDPSQLSDFFMNNACFNMMPFVVKQKEQSTQESPQEGELPRGKAKQEQVTTDESRQSATIAI